jgi:hypothetical protein
LLRPGPRPRHPVYFEPLQGGEFTRLNKAILDALSQPPLRLETRPSAQAVMISVPGKVDVKVSGASYSFTIVFSRDGRSLGESQQNCAADTLSDCADQIALDATTAAAPR